MRVLTAHNRYVSSMPSGENEAVDIEVEALRKAGIEVHLLQPSSDDLQDDPKRKLAAAAGVVEHRVRTPAFLRLLDEVQPDLVQVHNIFPLLGAAIFEAAARRGIPVVRTLHNYRFACLRSTYWRDDADCRLCQGLSAPWHGVRFACYRDSHAQSALTTLGMWRYRSRWLSPSRLLAVSHYLAEQAILHGADRRLIAVKPNAVPDPGLTPPPMSAPVRFVYAGRLEVQKGVQLLLDAWDDANVEAELHIAGAGELQDVVRAATARDSRIHVHGRLERQEVSALMQQATVTVVPSVCAETFSLTAAESMAHGRPVLATDVGGVPEVVAPEGGWVVPPTVAGLAAGLAQAAKADHAERGALARERYVTNYSPEAVAAMLIDHYEEVIRHAS